ncbi:MAG: AI-2E family transporter [Geminicoccaceae bacterium]
MSQGWKQTFRVVALVLLPLALVIVGLMLFKPILLPFLVGMAAAYLLDPAADRLEAMRFSRTAATTVITIVVFFVLTIVILLLLPPLAAQVAQLASELPNYIERLRDRMLPLLTGLIERFDFGPDLSAEGLIKEQAGQAISVAVSSVTSLLQSGVALINLVALMFVTPVVTFYLLRDWDRMVAKVRMLIPPKHLPAGDLLGRQIDEVLAGFIRGQGLVCLFLALFYAIGLWAVDLRYGLIIGLLTGLFSFVPFIGMALGMIVGLSVAAFQFQDIWMILAVTGIFGLGQFIEGNLISPRLVGSRIHLHPVWMIFAVLGGTAVFGLLGTFLAVPFAAVLGVVIRFAIQRYRQSALYLDGGAPVNAETSEGTSVAPDLGGVEGPDPKTEFAEKKTGTLG